MSKIGYGFIKRNFMYLTILTIRFERVQVKISSEVAIPYWREYFGTYDNFYLQSNHYHFSTY